MIELDLEPLREIESELAGLAASGWELEDHLLWSTATHSGLNPSDALDALAPLGPALKGLRVEGRRGTMRVGLVLVGAAFELESVPDGDVVRFFEEPEEQQLAVRLQDREVEAALLLPLEWRSSAEIQLGSVVSRPEWLEIIVIMSWRWLEGWLANRLRVEALVPANAGVRRAFLVLDFEGPPRHFGRFSLASHRKDLDIPGVGDELPAEGDLQLLGSAAVPPAAFAPVGPDSAFDAVTAEIAAAFAHHVWAPLATDVDDAGEVLTFVGLKKATARTPSAEEMTPAVMSGTHRLYLWAYQDRSPDRQLAVRQVVSLYEGDTALHRPDDILASAETVFVGLRTEAVAEVMKGARDAQAQALETVRQSVKAVQDLTKSATERLLASLVAIAAVVVANSTKTLTDEVGRNLLLLVATFLAVLAIYSIALEGPLLSLGLKNLDGDLKVGSPLLTDATRARVISLPSVDAARRRARLIRIAVPLTYLVLAAVIIRWGFPSRFI